jgi:hypothetical protein
MKKLFSLLLLSALMTGAPTATALAATEPASTRSYSELAAGGTLKKKKKRFRGYQKPKSKKILGLFNRRSSCDCPKY